MEEEEEEGTGLIDSYLGLAARGQTLAGAKPALLFSSRLPKHGKIVGYWTKNKDGDLGTSTGNISCEQTGLNLELAGKHKSQVTSAFQKPVMDYEAIYKKNPNTWKVQPKLLPAIRKPAFLAECAPVSYPEITFQSRICKGKYGHVSIFVCFAWKQTDLKQ